MIYLSKSNQSKSPLPIPIQQSTTSINTEQSDYVEIKVLDF